MKRLEPGKGVDGIAIDLAKELFSAGYQIDLNRLLGDVNA
jgi:hypothetical protein